MLRKCFPYRGTDSESLPPWSRRVGLFVFGMLQNGLVGGLIFGWTSIDQTLLSTPLKDGGAGLDLQQTTTIFTLATSISMVAALILGAVLDYSGPRIASMCSCLCISLGCVIFAFSEHFWGFATGMILIGFGGPGVGNCIIHLANLFPGNENLVMSCLSGSIAFSFSVFAVFDSLWTEYRDLSLRHLFGGYAVLLFALAFGSVLLFPEEPYEMAVDDDISNDDSDFDWEAKALLAEHSALQDDLETPKEAHHEKHKAHDLPHVSWIVEQPFNSYLRDKQRMFDHTDSFAASRTSLAHGGPAISLKDLPFWDQLTSAAYLRAFLVFLASTFVTNFYIGTLSTEVRIWVGALVICAPLVYQNSHKRIPRIKSSPVRQLKDRQDFSVETRHELSVWFTYIMSMGLAASLLVGWLIDRIGLEFCTFMTLMLGQIQMVLVMFGSHNESVMFLSFVAYTAFRAFCYPVFIGSLTSRLGFKYFGILLGLGFALSGVAQLLFPLLGRMVQGGCHLLDDDIIGNEEVASTCDHGKWQVAEMVQFIALGLIYIVPILDHRDAVARDIKIKQILSSSLSPKASYGSLSGGTASPDSQDS
jgi:MFS family permease